jgi:hypothetical protein
MQTIRLPLLAHAVFISRRQATYLAMSTLLIWHTLAILVGPAANSALTQQARKLLGPYLTVLGIDNRWAFFAPSVENGVIFRYEIALPSGERRAYVPLDQVPAYSPIRRWLRDRFREMLDKPDLYAGVVGEALCREHADLRPRSVTLIEALQKDFEAEDRLAGKSPFDPEFLKVTTIKTVSCPAS